MSSLWLLGFQEWPPRSQIVWEAKANLRSGDLSDPSLLALTATSETLRAQRVPKQPCTNVLCLQSLLMQGHLRRAVFPTLAFPCSSCLCMKRLLSPSIWISFPFLCQFHEVQECFIGWFELDSLFLLQLQVTLTTQTGEQPKQK